MTLATERARIAAAEKYAADIAAFQDDLTFFLDQGLNAFDIARAFRVKGPIAVERRLARAGLGESDLAERFRRSKPGYCPSCRRTGGDHLATCEESGGGVSVLRRGRTA